MKLSHLFCLSLFFGLLLTYPVQAHTTGEFPNLIEVESTSIGFEEFDGTTKAHIRDDGLSWLQTFHGGLFPNLLMIASIDLPQTFSSINFENVEDWVIDFNDSLLLYDYPQTDLLVTLHFDDKAYQISYEGIILPSAMECGIEDACQFLLQLGDLLNQMYSQSDFIVPSIPGGFILLALLSSIILPYRMYQFGKQEHGKRLIRDSLMIFPSQYLVATMGLTFVNHLFIPRIYLIEFLALFVPILIYQWYYNNMTPESSDHFQSHATKRYKVN